MLISANQRKIARRIPSGHFSRGLGLVASFAVIATLGACGDEKAKTTTTPKGGEVPTIIDPNPTDPNATVPTDNGGNGGGTTPENPVTGTNLVVTMDDVVEPAATYAFYAAPNSGDTNAYVSVLPYDYFDWVSEHDYASVPKTAKGSSARLNLTAMGVSSSTAFPFTYTVKTVTNGDPAIGFSTFDGACTNVGRHPTAGTITIQSWTGTGTSTIITGKWSGIKLFDNQSPTKKSSAADGTFITSTAVKPRASGAVIPAANADSAACNPVVYH